MIKNSLTVDLKVKLAHDNAKGLKQRKRVPVFDTKCVLINLSKDYHTVGFLLTLNLVLVPNKDEILYRGQLHPPPEIKSV